jgi:ABC-2 type transport system permease protein
MTAPEGGRRTLSPIQQLVDLTAIQLASWRWSWTSAAVTGVVAPLVTVFALSRLTQDRDDTTVAHLFVGSIVLGLCFENQHKSAGHFAFQRETGALGYFAALPIRHAVLIVATSLAFFTLSLPAMIVTTVVGAQLLGLALHPHLLLVVAVPAAIVPMAALGALIGVYAKNHSQAGALSTATTMLTVMLGGVLVPPDLLPPAVAVLGGLVPVNYAASALRQALLGPVTPQFVLDIGALIAVTAIAFILVKRRLRWNSA